MQAPPRSACVVMVGFESNKSGALSGRKEVAMSAIYSVIVMVLRFRGTFQNNQEETAPKFTIKVLVGRHELQTENHLAMLDSLSCIKNPA